MKERYPVDRDRQIHIKLFKVEMLFALSLLVIARTVLTVECHIMERDSLACRNIRADLRKITEPFSKVENVRNDGPVLGKQI